MGPNRASPTGGIAPVTPQTHTPCGSNPRDITPLGNSNLKRVTDVTLCANTRSDHWAESYQDLSSWCSSATPGRAAGTLMPAFYPSQVTDETLLSDIDIKEELDFDLRKSEEIASIPLEEDGSLILWGSGGTGATGADSPNALQGSLPNSAVKTESALLNDCWLFEIEREEVKEDSCTTSANQTLFENVPSASTFAQSSGLLGDSTQSLKTAQLHRHLERTSDVPMDRNRSKGKDIVKMLHEQRMTMFNNKKYSSPAAGADLHNELNEQIYSNTTIDSEPSFETPPTILSSTSRVDELFESLFSGVDTPPNKTAAATSSGAPHTMSSSVSTVSRPMVESTSRQYGADAFNFAHQELLRVMSNKTAPTNVQVTVPAVAIKTEPPSTLRLPIGRGGMIEPELNLDQLLQGSLMGINQNLNTPEVLSGFDAEGFDLLSYLCDDKANTPPVALDNNNPFHFPLPSSSKPSTITLPTSNLVKNNVMVVKPLTSAPKKAKVESKKGSVIVEVQPQIMPAALTEASKYNNNHNGEVAIKEEMPLTKTSRPVRSPRKRKLSEDYVVESPPPTYETTRSGRRRRVSSIKIDSDDDFTYTSRRGRKRAPIIEEDDSDEFDDEEEVVRRKRPRTSGATRSTRSASQSSESDRYRELRDRNNEASRKSRLTRKVREQELGKQAEILTEQNRKLKIQVEEMESLVKKLRDSLLQSMMKKS